MENKESKYLTNQTAAFFERAWASGPGVGYCPYHDDYTANKINLFTKNFTTFSDFESLSKRGLTSSGNKWYYYNQLGNNCCLDRTIRTDATKFKPNKSFLKAERKMKRFLEGKRELMIPEQKKKKISPDFNKTEEKIVAEVVTILISNQESILKVFEEYLDSQKNSNDLFQLSRDKTSSGRNLKIKSSLIIRLFWEQKKKNKELKIKEFINHLKEKLLETIQKLLEECWKVEINSRGMIIFSQTIQIIDEPSASLNEPTEADPAETKPLIVEKTASNTEEEEEEKKPHPDLFKAPPNPEWFDPSKFNHQEKKPHNLELKLVKSNYTKEKHYLYNRYNSIIHNEPAATDKESFFNFICAQNIKPDSKEHSSIPQGAHHLEFYLDGKLIGLLNVKFQITGLLSCFFLYDPLFKSLGLGVYSSLWEIETVKKYNVIEPKFKYYYMSSYIHENSKLNYKANYQPMQILCPVTRIWQDWTPETIGRLESGEVRLSDPKVQKNDENEFSEDFLGFMAEIKSLRRDFMRTGMGYDSILGDIVYDAEDEGELFRIVHWPDSISSFTGGWIIRSTLTKYNIWKALGKKIVGDLIWIVGEKEETKSPVVEDNQSSEAPKSQDNKEEDQSKQITEKQEHPKDKKNNDDDDEIVNHDEKNQESKKEKTALEAIEEKANDQEKPNEEKSIELNQN